MRMSDHLLQGLIISSIFILGLWSLIESNSLMFKLTFVGAFGFLIGIIYPDTDCKDSTIFRIHQKKEDIKDKLNRGVSFFVFPIAYILKFFVYSVEYFIVSRINNLLTKNNKRFEWTHRNLIHSIFGVIIGGMVIFIWGLIISLKITITTPEILVFSIFFSAGAFFHIIQDSFGESKYSGVKLFYPFSNKGMKGNLKWLYDSGDNRNTLLSFVLIGLLITTFFASGKIYEMIVKLSLNETIRFLGIFLVYLLVVVLTYYIFSRECQCKYS